jgi:polyhydroxyalkanoate synthesis regulator phasin
MFETLDKVMYAGLGAISMTRERAEKIFDDYVSRGKAEHEEKSGFVKDVMDTADKTRKEMEKIVNEQVSKVIDQMGLAKDVDLRRVEEKIDKLLGKGN